jgi:hypothetical protein
MTRDLGVQDIRARPAFGRVFVNGLATRQIVVLAYVFRQAAIHQRRCAEAQLLAPLSVLGLEPQDFV